MWHTSIQTDKMVPNAMAIGIEILQELSIIKYENSIPICYGP